MDFDPKKSGRDALRRLNSILVEDKVNWVVDADIAGFFDNVDPQWMMRCLEVRIADRSWREGTRNV